MSRKMRSIQSDLFITYSIIIIVVFLTLVVLFYLWISDLLTKRGLEYMDNLSRSTQQKLELVVRNMDSISMDVLYSNLVKDRFVRFISSESESKQDGSEDDLDNTKELRDILIASIGPAWDIQQINLYDFYGKVFGAGFDSRILNVSAQSMDWYSAVLEKNGKKVITLPYTDMGFAVRTYANTNTKYVSLCRVFFDRYNAPKGIVEVRQTYDKLFKNLIDNNASSTGELILVYDEKGNQIYPDPVRQVEGQMSYFNYIEGWVEGNKPLKVKNPERNDIQLVQASYSEYTGWYTVIVASERKLLSPLYTFTRWMVLFAFFLLFLALLLSFFAARKFTVPISQLHKAILSANLLEPEPGQPQLHGKINELAELSLAFQKMSMTTKKSLDDLLLSQKQEMQARMLALQSQMNPHFLYNTLTTVSVMAEEGMNEQIVAICSNVSDLLRYISSDRSPNVTLETELEYTRKYLACMQTRYGNSLSYSIDIDPQMNHLEVPKLILQPLVENALKYGIMTSPPWVIKISGAFENNRWWLQVTDNGSGFSSDVMQELEARMDEIKRANMLPSLELDGMGLLNVFIRLWLYYGNDMVFCIGNYPQGGAYVTIGGMI